MGNPKTQGEEMIFNRKVFKHRFYSKDEYGRDTPIDETESWEEAQEMLKKYKLIIPEVYMISKHFDCLPILPPEE